MSVLDLLDTPEWHARAACRGADPRLFFLDQGHLTDARLAKRICQRCPVVDECLEWALVNNERHGIWGNPGPRERRVLRRERGMVA